MAGLLSRSACPTSGITPYRIGTEFTHRRFGVSMLMSLASGVAMPAGIPRRLAAGKRKPAQLPAAVAIAVRAEVQFASPHSSGVTFPQSLCMTPITRSARIDLPKRELRI